MASPAMWHRMIIGLSLGLLAIPPGFAENRPDRVRLPVEVLGADGTAESRTIELSAAQSASVRALWMRVHGLCYAEQGSVQINSGPWIALRNETVTVEAPAKVFGGIGGGFATLALTVPLAAGAAVTDTNTVRFRFNRSDGLSSGFRVLAWNFLTADGEKVLPREDFAQDVPETWSAPLPDAASIEAGKELWQSAGLVASSLPKSPRIQARCADCHARDGRDLKYFNYSNHSIVTRSQFHGLTEQEGEQIASYIRSLPFPHPGRPWNPPYQPGPGVERQPVENWAAGAGLDWVLEQDADALPHLLAQQGGAWAARWHAVGDSRNRGDLADQITPELFRPDGDLHAWEIPVALQLPDWNQWLPRIHPKDAWGVAFVKSKFASLYDGGRATEKKGSVSAKSSLRALLTVGQTSDGNLRAVVPAFTRWSQARHSFLAEFVNGKTEWTPELSGKVYSTQLWQLVKTWEMMQEFALEGRGRELFGATAESHTWFSTVAAETAPAATHIPNREAGIGGGALTNEYLTASWYQLQIILNSGNHEHQGRRPVDWVYLIREFRDLYEQTHKPEPVRLLVAVTKALQSTDPQLGPDDYNEGWRPEQDVDPRIMVAPKWAPIFKALPKEVRRALVESLLAAWMEKNLQYPLTKYLPLPAPPHDDNVRYAYRDVSGGKVWQAVEEFRAAGVSAELVERLQDWGQAYTDRAARLQYHGR